MTDTTVTPRVVGIPAAAAMYDVGPDAIRAAIRSGRLRAKRQGKDDKGRGRGKYLIRIADLDAWFDSLEDA